MTKRKIDINCDAGESYGRFIVGNDSKVFPHISSCSIACGFHGGDPVTICNTIQLAIQHDLRIGAHPSYPDLIGFGRRNVDMSPTDLNACIQYQIAAIKGLALSYGAPLQYVKPHGALYNRIATDEVTASVVYSAIADIDPTLHVMGLAGSRTRSVATDLGLVFIPEAFADRRYLPSGLLAPRSETNSVITDADEAANQVLNLVMNHRVIATDGSEVSVEAESICIHGDTSTAIAIATRISNVLSTNGIQCSAS